MQWIDSIELYAYEINKKLVCKKDDIKRNNVLKWY